MGGGCAHAGEVLAFMPRIVLKPNSPEYATKEEKPPRRCDMPSCRHAAEYKAPKTRDLSEHYWFCGPHVKAYNEAWDYFAGLSQEEVEAHLQRGHKEGGGQWGHQHGNAEALREAAQKARAFHEGERSQTRRPMPAADTPEGAALALMELRPPLDLAKIKARYRELAKKYHPDRNGGCRVAEEHLKHINMAYTVLKAAWGRWEATHTAP